MKPILVVALLVIGVVVLITFMPFDHGGTSASFAIQQTNSAVATVSTQRAGNARTGEYADSILTPTNVRYGSFGRLWNYAVDGSVYAQPLIINNVKTPTGLHPVLLVATNNNSVYAFYADEPNSQPIWTRNFGAPWDNLDGRYDLLLNVSLARARYGILGTPVVVGAHLYFVTMTGTPSPAVPVRHELHVVELSTGADVAPPKQIMPTSAGVTFDSHFHLQRVGLLEIDGVVYVAFGANNDPHVSNEPAFQGWVVAYQLRSGALVPLAVHCTTCDSTAKEGGIWQGGSGLTADAAGNIYYISGNSNRHAMLGSSFVKLTTADVQSGRLSVAGSFAPANRSCLDGEDLDLGGSGVVFVSSMNRIIGAGKEGVMYLLDAANVNGGPLHQLLATFNQHSPFNGKGPRGCGIVFDSHTPGLYEFPHVHGTPAFWAAKNSLYVWSELDYLRRYTVTSNQLVANGVATTVSANVQDEDRVGGGMPGSIISLSTNSAAGTGILWATRKYRYTTTADNETGIGQLSAVDATTLTLLGDWGYGRFMKFSPPLIFGGRVYVSTSSGVLTRGRVEDHVFPAELSTAFVAVYGLCQGNGAQHCRHTVGDYDGDGRTDFGYWRPSTGTWFVQGQRDRVWGVAGDVPVPGDYDGDGRVNRAVWRPADGKWYIDGVASPVAWGTRGDIPVPADYNGDGTTDRAVFRPSEGKWYIHNMPTPQVWGQSGDIPVAGDYNGDGRADRAVFRPSESTWYVDGTNIGVSPLRWGEPGDIPVPGDYDGDGVTDRAVWRPSNGTWYVNTRSGNPQIADKVLGRLGDVPVPGDYNGDGTIDRAIWRPSTGQLVIDIDKGLTSTHRTTTTDVPLPPARTTGSR
jgi:hypothetical protein